MSSVIEAKTAMRGLATKAAATVANPNLTNAAKKNILDQIDVDLKAHSQTITVHEQASRLMSGGSSLGSSEGMAFGSDLFAKGVTGRAPSLLLDPEQQMALFKAVGDKMPFVTKAVLDSTSVDPTQYPSQFLPPVLAAREPNRIADILPTSAMGTSIVEYYVTTGSAAAGPVAEGAEKPESGIVFTKATATATKIAHWMQVTEEAVRDFAPFAQLLSADMIAGVIDAENNELLSALGTGASKFKGMLAVSGTQSYIRLTGDTILDAIEIAGSGLRSGGRFTTPDGIAMHPLDYSKARRTNTTQGEYVAGDPTQAGPATLWGTRVVLTSQIPQGTALVGNFAQACQVWVREGLSVRTNAFGSGFRSNEIEVIAEERLSLGVVAPAALSVVTISDHA